MDELFELIEEKISASGYPKHIDGQTFYEDVCEESEERENGTYMFLIKKEENLVYQGCVTILDEDLDLHYVDIIDGPTTYHVAFDEE